MSIEWRALLVGLATIVALSLAYQVRTSVVVDVGGKLDQPFLRGFHDAEKDDAQTYRWTRAQARVEWKGIALPAPWTLRLRLNGYRPNRPARVALTMNDGPLAEFDASGGWAIYAFQGTASASVLTGDQILVLANDTFVPRREIQGNPDPRRLGVAVDWVQVTPTRSANAVGNEAYWIEPNAPVIPPLIPLGSWAFGTALLYATARGIGLPRRAVNLAAGAWVLLLAIGFAWARMQLGQATGAFLSLALALALLALMFCVLAPRVWLRSADPTRRRAARDSMGTMRADASPPTTAGFATADRRPPPILRSQPRELALLCGILLLHMGLKWGGVEYPQFRSSDLLFHVHRLEFVTQGNLFFTSQLPDAAQRVVPYPPALYLFLAPLTRLSTDLAQLLLIANMLADVVAIFAVYNAARTIFDGTAQRSSSIALFAAFLFAFNPVSFWIYSWGNHTNIFGQVAATLLFVLLLTRPLHHLREFGLALFLFVLASTAHLGVFLELLAFALFALFLSTGISPARLSLLRGPLSRQVQYAIRGAMRALARRLTRERVPYLLHARGAMTPQRALWALFAVGLFCVWLLYYAEFTEPLLAQTQRFVKDWRAGQTIVQSRDVSAEHPYLATRAVDIIRYMIQQLGWALLGLGLAGLPLIWQRLERQARAIFFAWLAVAILFAFIGLGASFTARYTLWAAPALALSGGAQLAWLYERKRIGALVAYAFCILALTQTLWLWIDRVLYAYH